MRFSGRSSKSAPRWKVRLNYRLALILLTATFVMVCGAWVLRRQSLARNAQAFLRFAQSHQAAGEVKEALESVKRFLALVPNDTEGINLFAELTNDKKMGEEELQATYQLLSDFVARNPDRLDLRQRLFDMSFELSRLGETVELHLPRMRELVLEDQDYGRLALVALRRVSKIEEALELLVASIDRHPEKVSRYEDLIQFLGEQELNAVDLANLFARFSEGATESGTTPPEGAEGEALIDQRIRDLETGDDGGTAPGEKSGDRLAQDDEQDLQTPDGVVEELANRQESTLSVPQLIDRILEVALKKGSPPVDARVLRAKIQLSRENDEQALVELDEAAKLDPQDTEYLNQRHKYLLRRLFAALLSGDAQAVGQTANGIVLLEKSIDDSRKGSWLNHLMLGQFLLDQGDLASAEVQLRKAFDLGQEEKRKQPSSLIGRNESLRIDFLTHWGLVNGLIESAYLGDPQFSEKERERQQKLSTEVTGLIEEIRELDALPTLIEFIEARRLLVDRKWAEAAVRFEELRVGLADMPDIVRILDRSLVECYQRLKNPDEAIRALRRAISGDPSWVQGRLVLAEAYLQVGREDIAMEEFSQVSTVAGVPSVVLRLAIRREMGRPEQQRNWGPIQEILDKELPRNPRNAELLAIQCDVLRFQNRAAEGLNLVRAARESSPGDDALVSLEVSELLQADSGDREGNVARAEELLSKVGRDSAQLRLAKARVEAQRSTDGALGARLLGLSDNCAKLTTAEQKQLHQGLAAIANEQGLLAEALELMGRAVSLDPDNLELLASRVIMLMRAEAPAAEIDSVLSKIRDVDVNPMPNYHYLVGLRDLRDYQALGDADVESVRVARLQLLRSAEQSLSIAVKGRPSWVAARSQLSQVLLALGDEEASFRMARALLNEGAATPEAVTNVVQYLLKNQRDDELLEVVRELEQKQPLLVSDDVARAGMLASYRTRLWDETLQRLGRLDSSTVEDLLIQAQLLIARRGDVQRIEQLLTQALKLAPNQRQAWFFWMSFLIREQRMAEARDVLERIKTEVPEDPPQLRPWTLAQCEELLEDLDQADEHYSEAHRDNVSNLQIINEHIGFRVRHNRQQGALALLKLVADPASGLDDKIRNQAEILRNKLRGMTAKSYGEFEEALTALQANADLSQVSEEQLRAQLELYAGVGRSREQLKMISVLEELGARKVLSSRESMELAWLYSRNWRWADAVVLFRRILDTEPDNVEVHAGFVEAAVRRSQLDDRTVQDVAKSVSQLALRDPESLRTLACQVQWLNFERKSSDTEYLIRQFLKKAERARPRDQFLEIMETERAPLVSNALRAAVTKAEDRNALSVLAAIENRSISGNDPRVMSVLAKHLEEPEFARLLREQMWHRAAMLAEMSEQFELTDELYAKSQDGGRSLDGALEYMAYLSRRARFDEALELWQRVHRDLSLNVQARSLAAIVRAGKAPTEICAKMESVMRGLLAQIPEEQTDERVQVLLSLADLYDLQERFSDARAVYGKILESDPRNIVALNNLSILNCYSDKGVDRQRSVVMIDQAIEIAGPLPALLDSRAIVKLNLDDLDSAMQDLREALDQDSNPLFWLHLAYLQIRKNDLRGASESFERASDPKIEESRLHPLERPLFEELRRRLAPAGA